MENVMGVKNHKPVILTFDFIEAKKNIAMTAVKKFLPVFL